MVHTLQALSEAWRVLKPDGIVCDIHPVSPILPIEIVTKKERLSVGFIDTVANTSDSMERIIMATNALAIATHTGQFCLDKQRIFSIENIWDTFEEADTYYGTVSKNIEMTDVVRRRGRQMMAEAGEDALVSVQRTMVIGRYLKIDEG